MKLKFQTEETSETYLVLKDLSSRLKSKKKTYAFRAKQKSKAGDSDVCSEQ